MSDLLTACAQPGVLESAINIALVLGGALVPGAAWLTQLNKGRQLAKVADGLTEVISRHESPDRAFLEIAQRGQLTEAAKAVSELIRSKEGA